MEFAAIMAKRRVGCPKHVYSESCISGLQGTWTLGFCMDATQGLQSLYQYWFGSEAQDNHFCPFGPWSTGKSR